MLLATGLTYLLPIFFRGPVNSQAEVADFIDRLLPAHQHGPNSQIDKLISDLLRTRRSITVYSAIGFIWFSTRLFGSLRTVLAFVFDIETERSIIAGKIFDVKITVISTLLFVASVTVSTYVALATHSGVTALETLGLRRDVMGRVEAGIGQGIAFVFIALMFFALYQYLPVRRVGPKAAWVAAAFTSVAFEAARIVFAYYTQTFNPASLYTGTLTAMIVVVVWFYYAALIFILGGEVGQVFALRRVRRVQREVLTE